MFIYTALNLGNIPPNPPDSKKSNASNSLNANAPNSDVKKVLPPFSNSFTILSGTSSSVDNLKSHTFKVLKQPLLDKNQTSPDPKSLSNKKDSYEPPSAKSSPTSSDDYDYRAMSLGTLLDRISGVAHQVFIAEQSKLWNTP